MPVSSLTSSFFDEIMPESSKLRRRVSPERHVRLGRLLVVVLAGRLQAPLHLLNPEVHVDYLA